MMQDEPTPSELISAVAHFLRNEIAPAVTGAAAFKLLISLNALDLVVRQLTLADRSDRAELERLSLLLGTNGTLPELNRALAERIANGDADLATPGVAEHLWQTTLAKLAVDQPNYAAYKREVGKPGLTTPPPSS